MLKKSLLTFVYAILLFAGGIIGFIKAGSIPSLVMGIGFSILLLICAFYLLKKNYVSLIISIILTAILSFFFLWRFMQKQLFMPTGLMAIISLIVLLTLIALPNENAET